MPRIRHTLDETRHYRFNGVEFEEGERERDVDEETAAQATEHDDVEYVPEGETDAPEPRPESGPEPEPEGEAEPEPEPDVAVEPEDVEPEGDLSDLEYEELQALAMEQDIAANQSRDVLLEELSEAERQ